MCVVIDLADAGIADSPNKPRPSSRDLCARDRLSKRNPLQKASCTNAAILSAPRRKTCALYTYPPLVNSRVPDLAFALAMPHPHRRPTATYVPRNWPMHSAGMVQGRPHSEQALHLYRRVDCVDSHGEARRLLGARPDLHNRPLACTRALRETQIGQSDKLRPRCARAWPRFHGTRRVTGWTPLPLTSMLLDESSQRGERWSANLGYRAGP